jgi:hypothetical protein
MLAGMHGPTCIFCANLTSFSPKAHIKNLFSLFALVPEDTVRAAQGRSSTLNVLHSKSILYSVFA